MAIKFLKLVISIGASLAAGALGSFFTANAIPDWYQWLAKPAFNPPNWVFGPVWTALYIMMGIAFYLVWTSKDFTRQAAVLFGTQLFLNFLWSILFFGLQSPQMAFAGIVVLWIAIALTMHEFYGIKKKAAYLLIPYILWVSFAAVLNYSIWMLNPF
jgi:translocator protein